MLSPSGTMVREMVSVAVAMVCTDIGSLSHAWLTRRNLLGVPCSSLLVWCGLPRLLMSISAGAFLICRLVELSVSSLVSGYVGVG